MLNSFNNPIRFSYFENYFVSAFRTSNLSTIGSYHFFVVKNITTSSTLIFNHAYSPKSTLPIISEIGF